MHYILWWYLTELYESVNEEGKNFTPVPFMIGTISYQNHQVKSFDPKLNLCIRNTAIL